MMRGRPTPLSFSAGIADRLVAAALVVALLWAGVVWAIA
jgi:hypothetical protein